MENKATPYVGAQVVFSNEDINYFSSLSLKGQGRKVIIAWFGLNWHLIPLYSDMGRNKQRCVLIGDIYKGCRIEIIEINDSICYCQVF